MPLDFLVSGLASLFGLILVVAIILFGTALLHRVWGEDVESFGPKRVFLGYPAALAGVLAYSAWDAAAMAKERIARGILSDAMFYEVLPGWTVYGFTLYAVAAVFVLATFGVPLIVLSHRLKIASVATSCVLAVGLALSLHGLWFLLVSKNQWQHAHLFEYYLSTLGETTVLFVITAAAYALGARLPLLVLHRRGSA